ncbi:MAG: DUF3352 domain-containing protein [Aggregatilineales bacterium]
MRKLFAVLLIAALLAVAIAPVAATPVSELNALASYFPAETAMLISLRADDAFLAELDALLNRVTTQVPGVSPISLLDELDQTIQFSGVGSSFATGIRPWLGDVISIGIIDLSAIFAAQAAGAVNVPPPSILLVGALRDRAALENLFDRVLAPNPDVSVTRNGDYTLFTQMPPSWRSEEPPTEYYVDDAVFIVTNDSALLPIKRRLASSLADDPRFDEALAALTLDSYNMTIYVNNDALIEAALQTNAMLPPDFNFQSGPSQAWGFTILDERSLLIEIVQPITDPALWAATGTMPEMFVPVDLNFARHIAAGTPLVIHGTDLSGIFESTLQSLSMTLAQLAAVDPSFTMGLTPEEASTVIVDSLTFGVQGALGLNLSEDILSWMTGDFALTLGINPALDDVRTASDAMSLNALPIDFSLLIEATDPERARNLVSAISNSLRQFASADLRVSQEQIAGEMSTVLTIPPSFDVPFPIEIIAAANDEVFVIGTRAYVEAALSDGPGITADPSFIEMQAYLVDQPVSVLYAAGEGLTPLVNFLAATRAINRQDIEPVRAIFRLLSSSSISIAYPEDGIILRMVLTLP